MDWPQLTAFGALVAIVLTIGGLLARGQLWTKGQVEYVLAQLRESATIERARADTAQARADAAAERADIRERDMAASLATIGASSARIEALLAQREAAA